MDWRRPGSARFSMPSRGSHASAMMRWPGAHPSLISLDYNRLVSRKRRIRMDLALFIRRLKHPARPALALPRAQALGTGVTMSSLSPVPIVPGMQMDGAMGKVRSASDRVIPAFILLISALIADSGAQAQIAANPNDSNRVKVLEIWEASDSKASSVKRHKIAAAPANKKVVLRNTARHGRATTNEVASRQLSNSNMLVEPAISVDATNATSAQNDTPGLSPEQTGTAAVDTHGAALASSFGEDNNVGLVGKSASRDRRC